jgi:predicted ester cyclase
MEPPGHPAGIYDGLPPSGKVICGHAISIYRLVNGQIAQARGIWDRGEVWQQLGLIPDTETILQKGCR